MEIVFPLRKKRFVHRSASCPVARSSRSRYNACKGFFSRTAAPIVSLPLANVPGVSHSFKHYKRSKIREIDPIELIPAINQFLLHSGYSALHSNFDSKIMSYSSVEGDGQVFVRDVQGLVFSCPAALHSTDYHTVGEQDDRQ